MKFVVTKQIKEKRGKGGDNAKGSCQDPKTSVVIHDLLFFYAVCTVYMAIYLGNSLLRKR